MSIRSVFVQYFRCKNLIHMVQAILPLPFLDVSGRGRTELAGRNSLIEPMIREAEELNIDQEHFKKALTKHVEALAAGAAPSGDLENPLLAYYHELEDQIRDVPNTPDKARQALLALVDIKAYVDTDQVYEAMVILDDMLPSGAVTEVVRRWKQAAREQRKRESEAGIWWTSLDNRESIDAVSRYRFRDHFRIGEFESTFAEVEHILTLSLLEGSSGSGVREWGDYMLTSVAHDLWLISHNRTLVSRLRDCVDVALRRISAWQSPEGWWAGDRVESAGKDPNTEEKLVRRVPNTRMTAYCSLNLLKLAVSDKMKQQGVAGARWLLERQHPDGSWSAKKWTADGPVVKPDLLLTILALEAIARSDIKDVDHSLNLGLEWVKDQQDSLGMWKDDRFPFPFMTVAVLEFLQVVERLPRDLSPYLSVSKGFLDRSIEFSLEDNNNSHQLAIVSAFQGIEVLLYAILSDPSVNIKIFDSQNRTIGVRDALKRFQTYLQNEEELRRGEVIPYRNSLDQLAYFRDQIVHKGIDINPSTCRPLVRDALEFARRYSLKIFGHDPWV